MFIELSTKLEKIPKVFRKWYKDDIPTQVKAYDKDTKPIV